MSMIKDIKKEINDINHSDRTVRKFAISLLVLACIVGLFLWYYDKSFWYYFPGSGIFLLILSFVFCPAVRFVYYPLAVIGVIMGFFISKAILIVIYYTMFSFVGVFTRLFGIDLLKKKFHGKQSSYWDVHTKISSDPKQYEQLF